MKALFIDRDGIINMDYGYVSKIDKFEFSLDIFKFLRLFIDEGYTLFIVTNQSGIGRGYYSLDDFNTLTQWMLERFNEENIKIEEVYYCPHSPELKCSCRKPNIGMITQALESYSIELDKSWIIGDKSSDIELGYNAKIANSIFIGGAEAPLPNSFSFTSIAKANAYFQDNREKING